MKKKHESMCLVNCRKITYCSDWLGSDTGGRNAMCWEGATIHGVPEGWEGTVRVALTQFPNGKGHLVKIVGIFGRGEGTIVAGPREFKGGVTAWMRQALMILGGCNVSPEKFYVSFRGKNGKYIPCPWECD